LLTLVSGLTEQTWFWQAARFLMPSAPSGHLTACVSLIVVFAKAYC
jgi:hypothetical protein